MIVCSFALLLTFSAVIVLTGYIGYSIYKLIYLVTLMNNVKDIILMLELVICLIFTTLLIYLYLIDIFILIFNFLLDNILKPFNKIFKLKDFSIIDTIEEKLSKQKLFKKLLITSLILTAFFGLTGYILQSYIYRSYNQEIPTNNEQVIDLTKYNTLDTLKLEIDEANVYVKEGTTFELKINSEFKKDIYINTNNNSLNISTNKIETFDLFNFLK